MLLNKIVRNGLSAAIREKVIDASFISTPYSSPQAVIKSSICKSEKSRGGFAYFLYKVFITRLEIMALIKLIAQFLFQRNGFKQE